MFHIAITNEQSLHSVDQVRILRAVRTILDDEGMDEVTLSVAIVDDATIHRLNREFLHMDRPTDVLSFVLDETPTTLDAEVIVSADTAAVNAARYGWTTDDELLLYVIHGTLHLMGYDDQQADRLAVMRYREREFMAVFGLTPRYSSQRRKPVAKRRPAKKRIRHPAQER